MHGHVARPVRSSSFSLFCLLAWTIFFSLAPAQAQSPRRQSPVAPAVSANTWSFPASKFITALCVDQQNNLWVGTEDEGIWRCPADGSQPQQFLPKDGLGDEHCYALACDTQGRIWAGHQSHGVSVYNGHAWANYEVVGGLSRPDTHSGPLGERIFGIAVCPTDGDVWMATSLGLSRYRIQQGAWQYITRLEGLPSDQIQSLAFDKQGTLYCGTQCDGLAIAKGPNYAKWQVIQGSDKLPLAPNGTGLPTNLINDVLVTKNGTIWVATTTGLAWSKDKGKSFRFIRGADWADKVRGLYRRDESPTDDLRRQGEDTSRRIRAMRSQPDEQAIALEAGKDAPTLLEDYCTCLAEDAQGRLWVGHREKPYDTLDARAGELLQPGPDQKEQDHYLFSLAPSPDGRVLLGGYGPGLSLAGEPSVPIPGPSASSPVATLFPLPATPPSNREMQELIPRLQAQAHALARTEARYLGEDWATKGDWVGHLGRQFAILCAANWPLDQDVAHSDRFYRVRGQIDSRFLAQDNIRRWLHWSRSEQANVLYNPAMGYRRQAEWDDHGEDYPRSIQGPDLHVYVQVAPGVHRLSLYLMNKDGHDGVNRYRDYPLELRRISGKQTSGVLAHGRVHDFWGGVYPQFLVVGPGTYELTIGRNHSHNTICSAVLIDKLAGPATFEDPLPLARLAYVQYAPPAIPENLLGNPSSRLGLAAQLWDSLAAPLLATRLSPVGGRLAYRVAVSEQGPAELRLPTDGGRGRKEDNACPRKQ